MTELWTPHMMCKHDTFSPALISNIQRKIGQENPLEEGMATHSSVLLLFCCCCCFVLFCFLTLVVLPGESPWTEEPDRLQSIGLPRVGQNWSDWARRHAYKETCNAYFQANQSAKKQTTQRINWDDVSVDYYYYIIIYAINI